MITVIPIIFALNPKINRFRGKTGKDKEGELYSKVFITYNNMLQK